MSAEKISKTREFLLLSDFDQTLSFKDSGQVLAEMMGISDFHEHVRRLSDTHLVQQGGELAYLRPCFQGGTQRKSPRGRQEGSAEEQHTVVVGVAEGS